MTDSREEERLTRPQKDRKNRRQIYTFELIQLSKPLGEVQEKVILYSMVMIASNRLYNNLEYKNDILYFDRHVSA